MAANAQGVATRTARRATNRPGSNRYSGKADTLIRVHGRKGVCVEQRNVRVRLFFNIQKIAK